MSGKRGLRVAVGSFAALTVSMTVVGCGTAGADRTTPSSQAAASDQTLTTPSRAASSLAAQPNPNPVGWVANSVAVCVTVVQGVTPKQAVRRLTADGARRFSSRSKAVNWTYHGSDDRYWIGAGRVAGWTFVWEDNGYECDLSRPVKRTSAHGKYASIYWDVNDLEGFNYAVKGRIRRSFDPVYPGRRHGRGKPLRAEKGLPWGRRPEVSMVRLQGRVTGIEVARPGWLRRPGVHFWGYLL